MYMYLFTRVKQGNSLFLAFIHDTDEKHFDGHIKLDIYFLVCNDFIMILAY